MSGQHRTGCGSGKAFQLRFCCCAAHFPGVSCIASPGWLWDLGCFPGLRQAGAVLSAQDRGTTKLFSCGKALTCCPLLLTSLPSLQHAQYPAQGEFWSTGQEMPNCSEQGKDLAPNCRVTCSGNRLPPVQRLAGWLCVESWHWPKSINHRIKKL